MLDVRPRPERRRDSAALAKQIMNQGAPPPWWRRLPTLLLNVVTIGVGAAAGQLLADLVCHLVAR